MWASQSHQITVKMRINTLTIKGVAMINNPVINEISSKIKEIVNSSPVHDLEKNINALIRGALTKMELVSREEFDVQAEVLRTTTEKLRVLEQKLTDLEQKLK
jgi:ubiquinone biosynthesis accessory factor UbiK